MALRQIRTLGDPVLEKKCREVREMTPRLRELIADMYDTMYEQGGVGLAAPQVGVLRRIVVIDVDDNPITLINPVITFRENELSVRKCVVNGHEVNLAEYIRKHRIDTNLPLVADYNGVYINTSIRSVEEERVELYAPVFRNIEYRFATAISDYVDEFKKKVDSSGAVAPVLSCNCILNYQYGGLEGRKIPPFTGPVTFGEVAYQLLNQTLVYVEITE